ncbi:Histidinol-phosphate aminotransferase [Escherichia coli]|uniref:aminotransferase-like domain-containing protein n=1 Tax=Escherichia coli TaxID=562 RepID=UPI00052CE712|nr:PLP-dependent aminotransferase family protein [Escherichia coli]KGM72416.1 Histidinol-phosphate aminotransferase [Escherichia coli]
MTRYQHLATLLAERIEQGLYRHGEKLPSVRSLSQEHGVSISTVQQAYQTLETMKLITPQPRSGYFVAQRKAQPPVPPMTRPVQRPVEITQWDQVLDMLEAHSDSSIVPLSKSTPDVETPSLKPLWRELSRVVQHNLQTVLGYDLLAGQRVLREQMLRGMGVKVIKIPTDPETGISVEALELALEQWPIKGIILVPNCNNPLGFIMPDARKRAVLSLAQRHDIVIFEDDVYGELATEYPRPRTIHSWDIDGRVLLCSSFSKSIAPGLRVGWVAPGRYHDKLMHMKYAISSFNVPSTQMAAATFVLEGHYHRHIRRMRQTYQRNLALYTCWIREYFPCEICITRPKGGFLLWIELPEQVDMVCVARQLCRMKIQVAAGSIFSASGKYRNCLRINCALPLSETYREALKQIGEAVYRAME